MPDSSLSTLPMTITDGLLSAATWLASPNYNIRP
ncbi:MAG TPA: N-acetylmuramoyl-L-alanine amidase, partial [Psychrobacter sp.]|nr:N-acetylmuramoyl-L-alanine amidase [Psychrobacter sp.]